MSLFSATNQERPYEQLLHNWFEKRLPQPEIECTRRIHLEEPLQSFPVFHSILDLLLKTSFQQTFSHPITLTSYHFQNKMTTEYIGFIYLFI